MNFLRLLQRSSKLTVFTDGAIRPERHASGLGAVVFDENQEIRHWFARRVEGLTNNEAEYAAVALALEELSRLGVSEIAVYSDSQILVHQMTGRATAHAPGLRKAQTQLRSLVARFDRVTFQHIPRERNRLADALANDVVDGHVAG
jgi:ribonuclease HI